jgi:type II secretory pathway component PulF
MPFLVSTGVLLAAVLVVLTVRPASVLAQSVVYEVPILGWLWRYHGLAQFSRLMSLLLELEIPLPKAFRLTGDAVPEMDLKRACQRTAERVESGMLPADAMSKSRVFPHRFWPLIDWGQRVPALADAFRSAAELFEGHVRTQSSLLAVILLPIAFLTIATFVAIVVAGLFLPMIALITRLSG